MLELQPLSTTASSHSRKVPCGREPVSEGFSGIFRGKGGSGVKGIDWSRVPRKVDVEDPRGSREPRRDTPQVHSTSLLSTGAVLVPHCHFKGHPVPPPSCALVYPTHPSTFSPCRYFPDPFAGSSPGGTGPCVTTRFPSPPVGPSWGFDSTGVLSRVFFGS